MSEEEFDELLDLMSENNLTQHGADTLYGEIVDREIERKRLNNIVNELEKYLEEQHQFIIEIPAFTKEISIEHKIIERCYEDVLDKLQELKGSDKK